MEKSGINILEKVDILDYISQYVTLKKLVRVTKGFAPFIVKKRHLLQLLPKRACFTALDAGHQVI